MGVLKRLQPRHAAAPTAETAAGDPSLALIQRVGRGDQAAFGDLYDAVPRSSTASSSRSFAIRRRRRRSCRRCSWSSGAWPPIRPGEGAVTSWVATIAHRTPSTVSARSRLRATGSTASRRAEPPHDEVADSVVAVDQSQFERRHVRRALDRLTSMQREAVELAYFGGHTTLRWRCYSVPEGTVKTRIRDGMIRLRDRARSPPHERHRDPPLGRSIRPGCARRAERAAYEGHSRRATSAAPDVREYRPRRPSSPSLTATPPPPDVKARVMSEIAVTRQLSRAPSSVVRLSDRRRNCGVTAVLAIAAAAVVLRRRRSRARRVTTTRSAIRWRR